jgi:hypothetical protein
MRHATSPFEFVTASYLVRVLPERAWTLGELADGLRTCSDASIFHHTFQSLERHNYTTFSNDFAQWTAAACNEPWLAERLAAVDVRDITSLEILRHALVDPIDQHLSHLPDDARRRAFEPFYFSESLGIQVPLGTSAATLPELAAGIRTLSPQTIHHHFINSRIRLRLATNDFSHWIEHALGYPELARRLDRIDIYVNTLEDLRREILTALTSWTDV